MALVLGFPLGALTLQVMIVTRAVFACSWQDFVRQVTTARCSNSQDTRLLVFTQDQWDPNICSWRRFLV